jgi:hypothetical protein
MELKVRLFRFQAGTQGREGVKSRARPMTRNSRLLIDASPSSPSRSVAHRHTCLGRDGTGKLGGMVATTVFRKRIR